MTEKHASIDKASNGYVVYFRKETDDKEDLFTQETYIATSFIQALDFLTDYFQEKV